MNKSSTACCPKRQRDLCCITIFRRSASVKRAARARPGAAPEFEQLQLWQSRNRPILTAAVAELTKSLDRMPDETLCMAAMRFVYAKPFLSTALAGMFEAQLLEIDGRIGEDNARCV